MSRVIKFRFWVESDSFMGYIPKDTNNSSPYIESLTSEGMTIERVVKVDTPIGYEILPCDAVIMQFTGMYDVDGREIYEGDIVEVPHQGLFVVSYNCEKGMSAGWYLQIGDFEKWTTMEIRDNEDGDNYKVVGNIYENYDSEKSNKK